MQHTTAFIVRMKANKIKLTKATRKYLKQLVATETYDKVCIHTAAFMVNRDDCIECIKEIYCNKKSARSVIN